MHKIIFFIKLILFTYFFFIAGISISQPVNEPDFSIHDDTFGYLQNVISFHLKEHEVNTLHRTFKPDDKLKFYHVKTEINSISTKVSRIKVRGNSSKIYRRKSFAIKLPEAFPFYTPTDTLLLKKFYAVSLNMDKDYIRNAISYDVLGSFQICIPDHFFSVLNINDSSEGIYMIYYPPPDFALDNCDSHFVLRRGYNASIDNIYSDNLSKKEIKEYKRTFKMIYSEVIQKYHGHQLYDSLSAKLDLKNYFDWIAFNYLFNNGDYTDEVYFYWSTDDSRFKILPWDFDDILSNTPHEGMKARDESIKNRLFFSLEDKLDLAMVEDSYVYNEYLKEFHNFLQQFTPEELKSKLESIYRQLVPYYRNQNIIEQSKFDKYGLTNLSILKEDLNVIFNMITTRRNSLISTAEVQMRNLTP